MRHHGDFRGEQAGKRGTMNLNPSSVKSSHLAHLDGLPCALRHLELALELLHTQEVTGSSPVAPTIQINRIRKSMLTFCVTGRRSAILRTMESGGTSRTVSEPYQHRVRGLGSSEQQPRSDDQTTKCYPQSGGELPDGGAATKPDGSGALAPLGIRRLRTHTGRTPTFRFRTRRSRWRGGDRRGNSHLRQAGLSCSRLSSAKTSRAGACRWPPGKILPLTPHQEAFSRGNASS